MQISFNPVPVSIIPEYRIVYRLAQIGLILRLASRSEKASIKKIQFILSYLDDPDHVDDLIDLNPTLKQDRIKFRINFNPYILIAINICIKSNMLKLASSKSITMTKELSTLVQKIRRDPAIMEYEKSYLKQIGTNKYYESTINKILEVS